MTTVIYLDVLIAVNIFVTYILLVSVRLIVKRDTHKFGLLGASLLGGASSLIVFWDSMPLVLSIIYKLVTALLISFVAFLPKNKKLFLKIFLAFFLVNVIFGGVMYFVEVSFKLNNIIYYNGTVYFDISVVFLVSMTLICYGLLNVFDYFLKRKASENTLYTAKIYFRGEFVELNALFDTGNHLTDGIEGKPVCVAELNSLAPLFSFEELLFFKEDILSIDTPDTIKKYLRIIPCSSVTGDALMRAIIPEKIVITDSKGEYETESVIIAISKNDLSNSEYSCLLNSEIFERGKRKSYVEINK